MAYFRLDFRTIKVANPRLINGVDPPTFSTMPGPFEGLPDLYVEGLRFLGIIASVKHQGNQVHVYFRSHGVLVGSHGARNLTSRQPQQDFIISHQ